LEIANGTEPAQRDLVALLVRTPAPLLIGLALGLQMAAKAHPGMAGTLAAIQQHAMAAPVA
jgi:hypothetical protein